MSSKKQKETNKSIDLANLIIKMGLLMVALSFLGLFFIFYPVLIKEISYFFSKPSTNVSVISSYDFSNSNDEKEEIVAVNPEFSIVVPKINANSAVVAKVDPYNSKIYQQALTKGVAHALGTPLPGQPGNGFYFAHSSDNFYNANRYNSVFYLLNKMEIGDEFYLVYDFEIFKYQVTETKVVSPESVEYLFGNETKRTATLMTCWPAGTTLNRLVVVGELVN